MTTRIQPAPPSAWSEDTRALLGTSTPASESPDGEGPPNILYTIAHHPKLFPPFIGFTAALATQGVLSRRESEILALRAAWNCRSAFEWGHHVEYGLAAGLSEREIDGVVAGADDGVWSPRDRLLLRAADALHANQNFSDGLFDELRREWNDAQIVELTFVVGNYTMLSMVANATGVPIEERLPDLPTG